MTPPPCPHLGLAGDPASTRSGPAAGHRCFAQAPPGQPDNGYQRQVCFSAHYDRCPHFRALPPAAQAAAPEADSGDEPEVIGWPVWRLFYLLLFALILLLVGLIYGRDLLAPAATATPRPSPELALPTLVLDPVATPAPVAAAPSPAATPTLFRAPTPEPGGRVYTLLPQTGDVGWWASSDAPRSSHIGDSFLYAGYEQGQAFVAAFRLDLARLTRGAALRSGLLRLTGLREDRLRPEEGGLWSVALLPPAALPDFPRVDFQTLLNAPAAASLVPVLGPGDLARNRAHAWDLDAATLRWLEQQLLAGETGLIIRITGPLGGGDTLFAWDSGTGPATAGSAPELLISQAAPPATLPPLPTQEVIVATLTPTPANVLTVAAQVQTATAVAASTGTFTPAPANIATPTPIPANAATAVALGLPPLILPTLPPANTATATFEAAYATAVALTTGTFTPIPTGALRATLITPTPLPANAATAVAHAATATAQAQTLGAATPLPYYVLVTTPTPTLVILTATPRPESAATATEQAARVTLAAMAGATLALPANAATPTPTLTPTALPLLLFRIPGLTLTPTASPTPRPASLPASLRGRILFFSDRPAPDLGERTNLWLYDPASTALAYVTQGWVYPAAQQAELAIRLEAGSYRLLVEPDARRALQVFVFDPQFNVRTQVSLLAGMSYDPAWSPDGNRLAFVSQDPGNDEIYTVDRDGGNPTRLTFNGWEWDKHPSWSPSGAQIVFDSNRDSGRRQLWIMDANGANQRILLPSPYHDYAPIWVK